METLSRAKYCQIGNYGGILPATWLSHPKVLLCHFSKHRKFTTPLSHVFRTLGMHPIKPYSTKILLGIHLSFFIKFQIKTVGKVCNSAWKKMKLKCFLLDLIALYGIISAK